MVGRMRRPTHPMVLVCPLWGAIFTLSLLCGCGGGSQSDGSGAQSKGEQAPSAPKDGSDKPKTIASAELKLRPASEAKSSPFVEPPDEAETAAREVMGKVVREHGLDPDNAWAVAHALIVFGPDVKLSDGRLAVDAMFEQWAKTKEFEGQKLAAFPSMEGRIPVEPHPGLMLKSIAEAGVDPTHNVKLKDGTEVPVSSLYRYAAHQTYVDGDKVVPGKWNDTPWLLQGLATWAPEKFGWTAKGGHETNLDALTTAVATQLAKETKFLHDAMASGATVQKRKQGIFSYTCGGAHLIQGVAYATARGYGKPEDRERMSAEVDALIFRIDIELNAVDQLIPQAPQYKSKLLAQRLKFLGHTLESVHKMAALGLVELDEPKKEALRRVRREIASTVQMIQAEGLFDQLEQVKKQDYQLYLDLVGDSAHAMRGLMLADGSGTISI